MDGTRESARLPLMSSPGSDGLLHTQFPLLFDSVSEYRRTSPPDNRYNCIAWAAGDNRRFWWPDPEGFGKWPSGVPREASMTAFIQAFETLGYSVCGTDGSLEEGFEKVALFAFMNTPKHAAYQLPTGKWSSKIGRGVDCQHTISALHGTFYGSLVTVLRRRRRTNPPHPSGVGPA